MRVLGAIIALTFAAMAGSASAERFDLKCTGTMTEAADGHTLPDKPWSLTLHVDLDQNIWCAEECKARFPLDMATDDELNFVDDGDRNDPVQDHMNYFRQSGKFIWLLQHDEPARRIWQSKFVHGQCDKSTFTGSF